MEYFYIIGGCIIIILLIFFILRAHFKRIYKKNLTLSEIQKEIIAKTKENSEIQEQLNKSNEKLNNLKASISLKESTISSLNNMIKEKTNFSSSLQKIREEELDRLMEEKKEAAIAKIDREVEDWSKSAQEAANYQKDQIFSEYQKEIDQKYDELHNLYAEVNEYKAQRDAINQEILRSRALIEKQDFYRIQIDDNDKEDIHYLISIIDRFNNKETIYKLIWSEYLQKPFKMMLNRVLQGKDPKNVIYMIKNLNTQEIYIGKTKGDVSKRWTEHIKTSLNIGTISRSNIHKALFNHWDEYAFTVLEEVKNEDKLSERERYYINFYESNIYGYNIKSGG